MQGTTPDKISHDLLAELEPLREQVALSEPIDALKQLDQFLDDHQNTIQACSNKTLTLLVDELTSLAESSIQSLRLSFKQSSVPLSARARRQLFALLDTLALTERLFEYELRLARNHERCSPEESGYIEGQILSVHQRLACKREHLSALHLARVRAVSLMILDCFQSYVPVPENLYQHLHKAARQARSDLFQKHHQGWISVRASYLAILMLAMVNPYALRSEDMEEMLDCLRHLSDYVRLRSEPTESMGRYLDISGRIAPHVAISKGQSSGKRIFVDVEELFSDKALHDTGKPCRPQLERFLARLQLFIKPRETRQKIKVAQGLSQKPVVWITAGFYSAHQQLLQESTRTGKTSTRWALSGVDWLGAEEHVKRQTEKRPVSQKRPLELNPGETKPAEDLNFEGIPRDQRAPKAALNRPQQWELVDVSDGGLRVHWPEKSKCRIQVGDLLLIQPEEVAAQRVERFYVAVARWLRHANQQLDAIDVGVEQFAGQWSSLFAYLDGARMGRAESWPVLVSKSHNKVERIILPTLEDLRGQVLHVVDHEGVEQRIKLGEPIEQDVSYQLMEVARG